MYADKKGKAGTTCLFACDTMAKEWAKAFYNSKEWRKVRNDYIASVFGLCEECGRHGYMVHHKIPLTAENINDPNITLNPKNLKYLCKDCHDKKPGHWLDRDYDVLPDNLFFGIDGQLYKKRYPPS